MNKIRVNLTYPNVNFLTKSMLSCFSLQTVSMFFLCIYSLTYLIFALPSNIFILCKIN